MKRFYWAGILGALLGAMQVATLADVKRAPVVTRDNFVSLEYSARGNDAVTNILRIDEFQLYRELNRQGPGGGFGGGFSGMQQAWGSASSSQSPLSRNQRETFFKILIAAQLPKIVGKYSQKGLRDGSNEVLTLTISDESNRDQKFVIENYGNTAPPEYFKVTAALRDLQMQKFPPVQAETLLITRQNFHSLTLETSGGIAGIQSLIEISSRPPVSSIGGWTINFAQTVGGRGVDQQENLSPTEQDEIVRLLNAAKIQDLNGKSFKQPELADGFNEVLTLTLENGKKFTVSNYGDKAPAEYSELIQYLNRLKNKKYNVQ